MADLEIIAGKLHVNNEEVVLKSDTISRTQIVDFGTVVKNTRTVKANPFFDGVNDADIAVACTVRAEIFVNGMWSESGIRNDASSYGAFTVGFSNLEGIVVQSGVSALKGGASNISASGFGSNTSEPTSAPCRVIVTYHGDLILPSSAIVKPEYIDSRSLATAWVNFNSNGTIRDSFNVADVSHDGLGLYTVTFEKPMDNGNYTLMGVGALDGSDFNAITITPSRNTDTLGLSSTQVRCAANANSAADPRLGFVEFFGGKNV